MTDPNAPDVNDLCDCGELLPCPGADLCERCEERDHFGEDCFAEGSLEEQEALEAEQPTAEDWREYAAWSESLYAGPEDEDSEEDEEEAWEELPADVGEPVAVGV